MEITLVVDVGSNGGFLSLFGDGLIGWSGWRIWRSHCGSSAGVFVNRIEFRKKKWKIFDAPALESRLSRLVLDLGALIRSMGGHYFQFLKWLVQRKRRGLRSFD